MAQFLVVAVTLIAIYRQLRTQGSANALQLMNAFNQQWESDRMVRTRLQVALHLRNGDGFDELYPFLTEFVTFFGDMADLREKGHIPTQYVYENWGRTIEFWWGLLRPTIEQGRLVEDQPEGNRPFEELNALMRNLEIKDGNRPLDLNPEFVNRRLDAMIVQMTTQLRAEQEAKAGVIPTLRPASKRRRTPESPTH